MPCHAMPAMPWLGLARRAEASERKCVWGEDLHSNPPKHALTPNAIQRRPVVSKSGLVVLTFFRRSRLQRPKHNSTKKPKHIPSHSFGVRCLQQDTSDDNVQAHHTKPCHAMPAMPWLGLARRAEAKGAAAKPSQTCTKPQCHPKTPLFLKIGSRNDYLFFRTTILPSTIIL